MCDHKSDLDKKKKEKKKESLGVEGQSLELLLLKDLFLIIN